MRPATACHLFDAVMITIFDNALPDFSHFCSSRMSDNKLFDRVWIFPKTSALKDRPSVFCLHGIQKVAIGWIVVLIAHGLQWKDCGWFVACETVELGMVSGLSKAVEFQA